MTNENENNKPKIIPSYYIFEKDAEGNSRRIGAAFKHKNGGGFNIVIDKNRYTAFPPKPKS